MEHEREGNGGVSSDKIAPLVSEVDPIHFVTITPDRLRLAADVLDQDPVYKNMQNVLESPKLIEASSVNLILKIRAARVAEVLFAKDPAKLIEVPESLALETSEQKS